MGVSPMLPTAGSLRDLGADFAPLTLGGQPWRLVAAMFLHFGVIHVGMNMLCLYQAREVERVFGRLGFATLYLVAGLVGGVASLARQELVVSAGASGAVFGVFGAFLGFLVARRKSIAPDAWQKAMRSMGSFVAINLIVSLQAHIDLRAHVGGFATGAIGGAWLAAGDHAAARRAARSIAVAAIGVAISAAAVVWLPIPSGVDWLGPTRALITEFGAVEHQTVDAYNAALARSKAGELTDAQVADLIERDVIPPVRSVRDDIAVATIPGDQRALFGHLSDFLDGRLACYGDVVAGRRATDNEARAAALAQYNQDRATRELAIAAYDAELERLEAAH
jgi:rhomboid protease GluP